MRSSPTSRPDRADWEWIGGEVAILAELVHGVARRGGVEAAAVLDAVAEQLAHRPPSPVVVDLFVGRRALPSDAA